MPHPELMEDQTFLKSLRNRDEHSWQEAYDRFFPLVQKISTSFSNSLKPGLELKEIWQEAIIALYVQVSKGNEIRNLDNYMYTIILNLFKKNNLNHTEPLLQNQLLSPQDQNQDLERLKVIRTITEEVLKKINKLKGGKLCVKILKASLYREKSDKDLANELGISFDYVRVKRSRDCLPKFLELFRKHQWYDDLFGN